MIDKENIVTAIPKEKKEILTVFLNPGGIGEILLQTPFYENLKRNFPDIDIHVLIHKNHSKVLDNNPYIKFIYTFSSYVNLFKIVRQLRKKRFLYCYIFNKTWKVIYFSYFTINANHFIGFKRRVWESMVLDTFVRYSAERHETDYCIDLLQKSFKPDLLTIYTLKPQLYPSKHDYERVDELLSLADTSKLLCICAGGAKNPGVGDESFRRWPLEYYIELVGLLLKQKFLILLVGAKSDENINTIIKESHLEYNDKIYDLSGTCTITQTGIAMGKALLVITHDSGLMHIASCFNENLLCIFGPTSPQTLLPKTSNAHYLWADQDIYSPQTRILGTYTIKSDLKSKFFKKITPSMVFQEIFKIIDTTKLSKSR